MPPPSPYRVKPSPSRSRPSPARPKRQSSEDGKEGTVGKTFNDVEAHCEASGTNFFVSVF